MKRRDNLGHDAPLGLNPVGGSGDRRDQHGGSRGPIDPRHLLFPREQWRSSSEHDPEKHALGLDPWVDFRFPAFAKPTSDGRLFLSQRRRAKEGPKGSCSTKIKLLYFL